MKKKLLFFLCLGCFALGANAQWEYLKYPSYSEVVTNFFSRYSAMAIPNIDQLKFQKKPDGWHVVVFKSYLMDTIASDALLWSRSESTFKKVDFTPLENNSENKSILAKFLDNWDAKWFNLYPYYNYIGWDWDVIKDYKDVTNLPDSMIYALGRTYSEAAHDLICNYSGFADKQHMFKLPEGPNSLSPEQLATYRKYHNLAIENLKTVKKLNPNFETMVGNIGVKLANEYMVGYLDMLVYQDEKEANKDLADNIYDDFWISMAKNYLSSCDPNAILFTYGDNDTYPLLYVQAKYHFRPDVLVINIELLSTSRYIERFRSPFLAAEGLPLSFSKDEIKTGVRDFAYIYDTTHAGYMPLQSILDFEKSDRHHDQLDMQNGQFMNYIPTHKFYLMHGSDSLKWEVSSQLLYKNQLLILDVILTNKWKRPICFAITNGMEVYTGLYDYMEARGLAYQLVPYKSTSLTMGLDGDSPSINANALYNNLMSQFSWTGTDMLVSAERLTAISYRVLFAELARNLIRNNKRDSAVRVLDRYIELFPDKTLAYDESIVYIIQDYYDLGKTEKADAITDKFIYNLQHNIGNENGVMVMNTETKTAVVDFLKGLLQSYNRQELLNKLKEAQ